MAYAAKYILNATIGSVLDLRLKYGTLSLAGQTATVIGGAGVDYVYATAGMSVDFSAGGGSADVMYLDGAFTDYGVTFSGTVVTLTRGADTYKLDSAAGQKFVFTNGYVLASDALANGTSATVTTSAENSLTLAPTSAAIESVSFSSAGVITAAAGMGKLIISGSSGVDQVFVKAGAQVDTTLLGGSTDIIWFTGKWSDYAKNKVGNTLTFTREFDLKGDGTVKEQEIVTVVGGTGILNDKLVFADGYIFSKDALTNLNAPNLDAAGGKMSTTANEFTNASLLGGVGFDTDLTSANGSALDLTISSDTGTADDYVTQNANQTISGSYTGTLEDGDRIRVKLTAPDGSSTAGWVDALIDRATKTFTVAGQTLAEGVNTVQVELLSANGVSSLAGREHAITLGKGATITLDQTSPSGSVSFFSTPDGFVNASEINDTTYTSIPVKLTLDATVKAGDTVQLQLDLNGTVTPAGTSYTITAADVAKGFVSVPVPKTSVPTDGTYKVTAVFLDPAGNTTTTASIDLVRDTNGPASTFTVSSTDVGGAVINAPGNDAYLNNQENSIVFEITEDASKPWVDGDKIEIFNSVTKTSVGATYTIKTTDHQGAPGANKIRLAFNKTDIGTADGSYQLSVRTYDAAGNINESALNNLADQPTNAVTIDSTGISAKLSVATVDPANSYATVAPGGTQSTDKFLATNENTVVIKVDSTAFGSNTALKKGDTVTLQIETVDGSGNKSFVDLGTYTAKVGADDLADGDGADKAIYFTVNKADLPGGATSIIQAKLTDTAGNVTYGQNKLSLTVQGDITLTMDPNAAVANNELEVTSAIVLKSSQALATAAHVKITITNNASGTGFEGQTTYNSIEVYADDARYVTISGDKVIINPPWDFDFGSNYTVTVGAGAFSTAADVANGIPALGTKQVQNTDNLNFNTISLAGHTDPGSAVQGHVMDATTGQVTTTGAKKWFVVNPATTSPYDLDGEDYAVVFKDLDSNGSNTNVNDGVAAPDFNIAVNNFDTGDLIYVDDQSNALSKINDKNLTQVLDYAGDGSSLMLHFDPDPSKGFLGGNFTLNAVTGKTLTSAGVLSQLNIANTKALPTVITAIERIDSAGALDSSNLVGKSVTNAQPLGVKLTAALKSGDAVQLVYVDANNTVKTLGSPYTATTADQTSGYVKLNISRTDLNLLPAQEGFNKVFAQITNTSGAVSFSGLLGGDDGIFVDSVAPTPAVMVQTGQDQYVTATESGVDLVVKAAHLKVGDTLKLLDGSGKQVGTSIVIDATTVLSDVVFNVAKGSMALGANNFTVLSTDTAGNQGSSTIVITRNEYVAYNGTVGLGPVVSGNDLQVTAYDQDGKILGTSDVSAAGTYTLNIDKAYSGKAITLRVANKSAATTADYRDESTGNAMDMGTGSIAAVVVADGTSQTVHISAVTDLVARQLNINNVVTASTAQVTAYNKQLATLLGLSSTQAITDLLPTFTVDSSGTATLSVAGKYGQLLAQISDQQANSAGTLEGTQNTLANGITWTWDGTTATATVSGDMAKQVVLLAKVAQAAALSTGASATPYLSDTELSGYGITGVSGLNAARKADLLQRIVNSKDDGSDYDTISELQVLASKVVALAKIQDYANNSATNPAPTLADYTAAGITGVTDTNLTAVNSKMANSLAAGTVPDDGMIQSVATLGKAYQEAAIAKITAYAAGTSTAVPTVANYLTAGIKGVTTDNLAVVNAKVDANAALGNASTVADVQTTVNGAVADYSTALDLLRAYIRDATANTAPTSTDFSNLGLSDITSSDQVSSAKLYLSQVMTPASADLSGSSLVTTLAAQQTALAKINSYAASSANPAPTAADYIAAGIKDANSAILPQLNSAVSAEADKAISGLVELSALLSPLFAGVPTLSSIVCAGSSVVNGTFQNDAYLNAAELGAGASVKFTVTFDRAVTGVTASNFGLTDANGNAFSGLTPMPAFTVASADGGAGKLWTVTATNLNGLTGSNGLRLNLVDNTGITDTLSGKLLATSTYTSGQSYTIDTTNVPTLAIASGQDDFLNSTETGVDLYVDPANLRVGDTLKLIKADGSQLGSTVTVTASQLSTGVTFTVSKSSLSNGSNVLTLSSTDAAGNPATATTTVTVGEYVQVTGMLGLSSKVLADNDLKVTAYDASNNVLGTGTIDATTSTYTLQLLKGVTGKVKLQLTSGGTAKDYFDEATAAQTDLGSMAMTATISADGTAKTANITLLSDLAARIIEANSLTSAADITAANLAISKLLLGNTTTAITAVTPDFGVTSAGAYSTATATLYGQLLNQLSQQALVKGRAIDVVLEDLVAGLSYNTGTGLATLNNAFAKEVFLLAKVQMAAALSTGTVLPTNSGILTVQDLIDHGVTGLSGLSAGRKADLIARIVNSSDDGNAFDTLAEVQAVADKVVALGKIQDYAASSANPAPTLADYAAADITGVTSSNLNAVNARIDASDSASTASSSLIQTVVNNGIADNTTAIAKIAAYANLNTNAAPTVADYAAAGVTGVTAANLTAVNAKVDAEVQTNANTTTLIQALANAGATAYNDAITTLKNYIASGATADVPTAATYRDAGLPTIDTAAEVANANYYLDQVYPDASSTLPAPTILAALTAQQAAMTKIDAYAANNTNPQPTIADYTAAGITGASTSTLGAINTIVDGYAGATASTNTTAGLKAAISTLFTLQPTLLSITPAGSTVVNGAYQSDTIINAAELGASVKFTVAFDRAVTGLSASNFKLVDATGILVSGVTSPTYSITSADGGKTYTVSISGLGSMTSSSLRLDLANNTGITDMVSGQAPLTSTFTTGGSYTVDTTFNTTVVAKSGEDLTLDSGESAANIFVDASKLAVGDTLTLKLTGGATLATTTVSAADITAGGVTLTVPKSSLSAPASGATSDLSNAITLVHADTAGNLSSVNSAIVVARTVTVSGTIGLGPVVSTADLSVTAYDSAGKALGTAAVNSSTGQYSLAISRSYSGPLVLRVSSTGSGADYRDEASNANVDLGTSSISAVITADGSNKTAHITALTDIAARMVTVSGGLLASGTTSAKVDAANLLVSKNFIDSASTQGIASIAPDFSVTTTGAINTSATRYGQLLAGLSKQALDSGAGLAYTQATVANSITFNYDSVTPANSTMALGQAAKDTVFLAKVAQAAALATTATVGTYLSTSDLVAAGFKNFTSLSAARQSDVITRVVNGADDGSLTNTVAKVQALIDKVQAIGVIQDYKTAGGAAPTVDVYVTAGFTGVNTDNLATVNSAVMASLGDVLTTPDTIIGAAVTSGTSLQATALSTITAYATANTNAVPTVQNYLDAGLTGVTATNLAAVNARIDAKVAADVNTVTLAQAVVDAGIVANTDAIAAIKSYVADSTLTAPSLTTYRDAGLATITTTTQVDNANYLCAKVLAGTAPTTAVLSTKLAAQITAINKINAYAADNTKSVPAVSDYTDAGFSQVTASNLTEVNKRVDTATTMNSSAGILALLRAMDLDSTTLDVQTSATQTAGSGISVGRQIFPSINKSLTDDIASIKVVASGTLDATNDQIVFGNVSHAIDANALTGTGITVNGVSGIDWAYSSSKQLLLTKTDGTAFTAAEAQLVEQGIRFASTSPTSGGRVFTITHTASDGAVSSSGAVTMSIDTSVSAVDLDAATAGVQATGTTSLTAAQAIAGKAIVATTLAAPTDTDIGAVQIVIGGANNAADWLVLNAARSLSADFSASNVTIGTVTGVSYTYLASTKTLVLTPAAGGAFTPANIATLVAAIKFQTTSVEEGSTRTFTISYLDILGNVSSSAVSTMTVDTKISVPSVSLAVDDGLSATDAITTNAAINVSGIDAGATWQYSTNGGTSWTAGTGSSIAASAFTGTGAKTVMVRATDAAGNTATSANYAFNVVAAPTQTTAITTVTDDVATNGSVTGTLTSGRTTDDSALTVAGTISAALTANQVVAVYDGATRLGTAAVSGTTWTYTTPTLSNAGHSLSARVENTVDQTVASFSAAHVVSVNTSLPTSIVDDVGGVTGTLPAANAVRYITLARDVGDGGFTNWVTEVADVLVFLNGSSTPVSLSSLGTASVRARTATSPASNILDGSSATSYTSTNDDLFKWVRIDLGGSYNVTGVRVVTTSNAFAGGLSVYTSSTDTVNSVTLNLNYTSRANMDAATGSTAGLNKLGMTGTIAAGGSQDMVTMAASDDNRPTFTGSLPAALGTGEELAVYATSTVTGATSKLGVASVSGNSWSFTPGTAMADGSYNIKAMVQNAGDSTGSAGRVVSSTLGLSIFSSTAAPTETATITTVTDDVATNGSVTGTVTSGQTTDDSVLVVAGTLSAALNPYNQTVAVYDGATKLGNATVSGTSWTFTTPTLSNASHSLTARVENTLNGTAAASSPAYVVNVNTRVPTSIVDDVGGVTGNLPAANAVRYITLARDVGDGGFGNWITEIADVMVFLNGSSTPVSPFSLSTASAVARAGDAGATGVLDGASATTFTTANDGNFKWLRIDLGAFYNVTGVRVVASSSASANGLSVYTSTSDTVTGSTLNYTSRVNMDAAVGLATGLLKLGMTGSIAAGGSQDMVTMAASDDNRPTVTGSLPVALGTGEELAVYATSTVTGATSKLGVASVSGNSWSPTPGTAMADGVYNIKAMVQNAGDSTGSAGRVVSSLGLSILGSAAAPTQTVTITTVTDDVATNGSVTGALTSGRTTDDNVLVVAGTLSAALAANTQAVAVYDGATRLGYATVTGTSWTFTTPTLSNGSHSFTARVENALNGTSSAFTAAQVFNVANSLPMTVLDDVGLVTGALASGAQTDDTRPTFSGTLTTPLAAGEELAIYQTLAGVTTRVGVATVTGSGWTFTPGSALADGAYTFRAMVQATGDTTGTAGRLVSASSVITVVGANAAPTQTATITSATDDVASVGSVTGAVSTGTTTDDNTLALAGTVSAALGTGQVVAIYDGATRLGNATVTGTSWTFTTPALSNAAHSLTARVENAITGVSGPASAAFNVVVDTGLTMTLLDDVGVVTGPVTATATDDNMPTFTGTLDVPLGLNEELAIYSNSGGPTTKMGVATVTGTSWTFTPTSPLVEGPFAYTFTAMVQNAGDASGTAGRLVASASKIIQVTNTSPTQSATITSVSDNVGANGSVTGNQASGVSTDDSVLALAGSLSTALLTNQVVAIYDGTTKLGNATISVGSSSWSFSTPALGNGAHSLTARVESLVNGSAGTPSAAYVVNVHPGLVMSVTDDVGTLQGALASVAATDDNRPTFSGTLAAALGTGEEVALYQTVNGVTTRVGVATVTGANWTFTPATGLADGVYNFRAMVQPAGDTTGAVGRVVSASSSITIDTAVAPTQTVTLSNAVDDVLANGSVSGTMTSGNTADDTTPTLSGTVSAPLSGSQVLAVYDGATKLGNATLNGSNWTFTAPALSNGVHNLTARVENAASGTQGTASSAFVVNVNNTLGMNVIDAVGAIKGTLGSVASTDDNKPTFSGTLSTALQAGEEVAVYQTTGGVTSRIGVATISGLGWSFTPLTAIADGAYSFKAMVQPTGDTTGTLGRVVSASSTLTIDTVATAPTQTVSITSVADDVSLLGSSVGNLATTNTTDDTTPTLSGTVSAALTGSQVVAVYDGATWLGNATMTSATAWTFSSPARSDGSHSFTARVENAASGAQGTASSAFVVNVDSTLPMTVTDDVGSTTGTLASVSATDDNRPTFSGALPTTLGTGEEVALYQTVNGVTTRAGVATVTGTNWTYTPTAALADGVYSFKAMVQPSGDTTGALGRVVSASSTLTISTAAVTQTVAITGATDNVATNGSTFGVGLASGSSTDDSTPTLNGTLSAALVGSQVVNVYEGAALLGTANVVGQTWSFTTPVLSTGLHSLVARVEDPASGLAGANASAYTVRVHGGLNMAMADDVGALQGSVQSGGTSDDLRLTFSGTLDVALPASGEEVAVYATNVGTGVLSKVGTATVTGGTSWSLTPSADMAAGTYVFKAMVQTTGDSTGNTGRVVSQSQQVTLTATDTTFSAITNTDPVSGLTVKTLAVAAGSTLDMNNYTHNEVDVLNLGAGATAKIDLGDVMQNGSSLFTSTNFAAAMKSGGLQQMVINGGSTSFVVVQADAGGTFWTKSATSVSNSGHTYDVYNNSNGLAQLLIDQQVQRSGAVI